MRKANWGQINAGVPAFQQRVAGFNLENDPGTDNLRAQDVSATTLLYNVLNCGIPDGAVVQSILVLVSGEP